MTNQAPIRVFACPRCTFWADKICDLKHHLKKRHGIDRPRAWLRQQRRAQRDD